MIISKTIEGEVNRTKLRDEIIAGGGNLSTLTQIVSLGSVFTFTFELSPIEADLDTIISNHDNSDTPIARVYAFLGDFQEPTKTDFGIIGLYKKQWAIEKGRRISREYMESSDPGASVVVRDSYEYTYVQDSEGQNTPKIKSYARKIEWLMPDNSVGFEKTISTQQSDGYINRINREVRQGQMDKLMQDGNQLRIEAAALNPNDFPSQAHYEGMRDGFNAVADALDVLWIHYETEIAQYIQLGGSLLWDAVEAEADPSILGILGIVVDQQTLRTVKDNIEYQIT